MNDKRASTPNNEPSPQQLALHETLLQLNSDPRVMQAMQEHLLEQVANLRLKLKVALTENEELKKLIPPRPPKAKKKGTQPRGGRGSGSSGDPESSS